MTRAPNVAEATKLANELAPLIAGHHAIEYRLIRVLRDDDGHYRQVEQQGSLEVDIVPGKDPIRIDPSSSASYGLTPVLSTDSFERSLPRADERGVVDSARTMVHEWGHTSLNRMITHSEARTAASSFSSPPPLPRPALGSVRLWHRFVCRGGAVTR